jgi:hypothetical protein
LTSEYFQQQTHLVKIKQTLSRLLAPILWDQKKDASPRRPFDVELDY